MERCPPKTGAGAGSVARGADLQACGPANHQHEVSERRTPGEAGKRFVGGLLSTMIVIGIFVGALPRIAGYADAWRMVQMISWQAISILTVIGVGNVASYRYVKVAVLPGLTYRRAATAHLASTAVSNTMPAGGMLGLAVTYSMLRSWGFARSDFALAALVSGAWNNLVRLGLPVVTLAMLAVAGKATRGLLVASVVGVAVLITAGVNLTLAVRTRAVAARVGRVSGSFVSALRRLVRKPAVEGWQDSAVRFSTSISELLGGRWLRITVATWVSHLSLYLVLLVALRLTGVSGDQVDWVTVLAACAFVRLISALPITPGGLGVVELG